VPPILVLNITLVANPELEKYFAIAISPQTSANLVAASGESQSEQNKTKTANAG
jgi:hypothetical protein